MDNKIPQASDNGTDCGSEGEGFNSIIQTIKYEKGIFGVFEELSWNSAAIEEVIENLELIGEIL